MCARRGDWTTCFPTCRTVSIHGPMAVEEWAGILWYDYIAYKGNIPFNATSLVMQALRPKQKWRDVASQCVRKHASSSNYVALHARVELDMMRHNCGQTMEKNFTKILDMVSKLTQDLSVPVQGIFVAVSRNGMENQETQSKYEEYKEFLTENINTMNRIVGKDATHQGEGLRNGQVSVFECGKHAVEQYYKTHPGEPNCGSLLHGMVNFYIATEATAFVGVRGSSYSNDIWTTRYHQGKGNTNYEYTPHGIVRIGNGGLPPSHTTCK